jgi:OOP family OmpA-OmpF porin
MRLLPVAAAVAAVVVSGCAVSPETISCLQPNRRVVVEVGGTKVKPPPKPAKEGEKPGKPGVENVMLRALVQGDEAWDHGSAVLKDGGKAELDRLVKTIGSGAGKDTRSTNVGSIIITGHTDRYEAEGRSNLDEQRAVAVRDYLASRGLDQKLMFWEGKGAREPVPVTKFCEG